MQGQKFAGGSVAQYLRQLPEDRATLMGELRRVILQNLPLGYAERLDSGAIFYEIPLTTYPHTHNRRPLCMAALASRKSYVTLYLMAVYADPATAQWFRTAYERSGKKLDMGKSCVHFSNLKDVPMGVVGRAIANIPVETYIRFYENARKRHKRHK